MQCSRPRQTVDPVPRMEAEAVTVNTELILFWGAVLSAHAGMFSFGESSSSEARIKYMRGSCT
jgi:hypothetical protein